MRHYYCGNLIICYFTFVPAGTLGSTAISEGSPSIDAARTMPFDSTPISFAG
jgi:hypothetical protein